MIEPAEKLSASLLKIVHHGQELAFFPGGSIGNTVMPVKEILTSCPDLTMMRKADQKLKCPRMPV
jgi:hypothetical protein